MFILVVLYKTFV